ncbi:hypothetical protein [Sphingobacterium deserti]|uniref:hypothetical protein n=1 Tax=Sphingobacterium deserti TaxID=1229276 RepID=UPI0010394A7D|nr:hypothetical protein [Sphingobacterium deserti]
MERGIRKENKDSYILLMLADRKEERKQVIAKLLAPSVLATGRETRCLPVDLYLKQAIGTV